MILRSVVLVLTPLISTPVSAEWTRADTHRQLAFTSLQVIDWLQTRDIATDPNRTELNPILGSHPSLGEVNAYFAATTLLHWGISYMLPPEERKAWQCIWIGAQAGNVTRNFQLGVGLRF